MVSLSGAARRSDPGSFRACFAHLLFREDYTSGLGRVDKCGSIAAILSDEAVERLSKMAEKVSGVFDKSRPNSGCRRNQLPGRRAAKVKQSEGAEEKR